MLARKMFLKPKFYCDLVYKFKTFTNRTDLSAQVRKVMIRYKPIVYNVNVMRRSACLQFTQSLLITCCTLKMLAVGSGVILYNGSDLNLLFQLAGIGAHSSVAWSIRAQLMICFRFRFAVVLFFGQEIFGRHITRCICWVRGRPDWWSANPRTFFAYDSLDNVKMHKSKHFYTTCRCAF